MNTKIYKPIKNRVVCRLVMVVGVLIGCLSNVMAGVKIVVLTDLHTMAPELLVSGGTAWDNYLASDRKLVDYSRELLNAAVSKIKNDIRPDAVLVTGDLTKDGEVLSHQYLWARLTQLVDAGIKVSVIPGNHDFGTGNAKYYDGDNTSNAEVLSRSEFASMYADCGYKGVKRDPNSLSYCRELFPGLAVIGIDSGADGAISEASLSWIEGQAKECYQKGKQVIAMIHHPLVPHFQGSDTFMPVSYLSDYENVRNRLADAGVRMVLTGHFHTSDIATDFNADLSKSIIDVNTGSLVTYPCHYRVLEFSDDMLSVSVSTGSITEIEGVVDFPSVAKERLRTAVKTLVNSMGKAYSTMASTIADAFIYHAEGDEDQNSDAQSKLSTLLSAANLARMTGAIEESKIAAMELLGKTMLGNICNYGISGRQTITRDLSLPVQLNPLSESVFIGNSGWATFVSDRYLDFSSAAGLDAFIATGKDGGDIRLESIGVVPPMTGILLRGSEGSYNVSVTDKDALSVTKNVLVGSLSAVVPPVGSYVLSKKNGIVGFYKLSNGIEMPAGKAYIPSNSTRATMRSIRIQDNMR